MARLADIIESAELSIPELFRLRLDRSPTAIAYRYYDGQANHWIDLTWSQMETEVGRWQAGLAAEGFMRGDRVAVMLPNGPDWVCFDLAAMSAGLVVVPLYANDRPENLVHILEHTNSRLLLCPSQFLRERLFSFLHRLPMLERIVCVDDPPDAPSAEEPKALPLTSWLPTDGIGPAAPPPQPDDLATIVFTSGTTGPPKGVMLSHRNILENCSAGLSCITIYPDDLFLSFLPLSHMLERMAGYYLPMMAGATVAYSRSIQELQNDMATVRPTVLVAVPKIFERMNSRLSLQMARESATKQKLFRLATDIGWRSFLHRQFRTAWSTDLLLDPLLQRLVGEKVRSHLGGRLRVVISGGAPLAFEVARTFIGLGINIYQGYGLTEASPVISVNRVNDNRPEGVGILLPGLEAKVGEHSELLVRGPSVMLGYWRDPEATAIALDQDGWLHTGDLAVIERGHLRITGRLKDILVLSSGEKISPTDMETAISADALFEQTIVVGEGRPYLTLIAVLNAELWKQLATSLGLPAEETALADESVRKIILHRIEACLHNFPGYAWIKDIHLSLKPWTVEQGLLTPTLKARRKSILSAFHDEVERMYQT